MLEIRFRYISFFPLFCAVSQLNPLSIKEDFSNIDVAEIGFRKLRGSFSPFTFVFPNKLTQDVAIFPRASTKFINII